MTTLERRRVIIYVILLALAAGLAGLATWKGVPIVIGALKWQRWQKEMGAEIAQRAQIEADWNRQFGPVKDFPNRHPATADNETAKNLDAELAAMDMDGIINSHPVQSPTEIDEAFNSASEPETHPKRYDAPSAVAERAKVAVSKRRRDEIEPVTNWLNAQIEQPADLITALNPALVSFLHSKADGLARIRTLLAGNAAPVWRADYSQSGAPIVNLLGFIRLQRLLATDATLAMQAGDSVTASGDLHVMSVLNRAMTQRPELISLLVALATERYRLATLRTLTSRAFNTPSELAIFDDRADLREMFIGEAWLAELHNREAREETQKLIASGSAARRSRHTDYSMLDAWRLDTLRAMTLMFSRALSVDACTMPAPTTEHDKPADWNISGLFIPKTDSISRRVQRLEMESEMTRKVVLLAQARESAGNGELNLPADFADSGCKAGHWRVEKSADGQSITLRFSEPIDWGKNLKGAKIPLQFTLHTPPNRR